MNGRIAVRVAQQSSLRAGDVFSTRPLRLDTLIRSCSSNPAAPSPTPPAPGPRDDAALARRPHLRSAGGLLRGLDYAGTVTFALTGTVAAAQSGLDVFGSALVGVVTAVGGGTVRDAVVLSRRPFWTEETEYLWLGLVTGVATFFAWPSVLRWREEQRQQRTRATATPEEGGDARASGDEDIEDYDAVSAALDTLDAVGLSTFAIVGAQNGLRACVPLPVSALCGMATATFGGLTRDLLCGRPVRILHSTAEVYALPALAGAVVYLSAQRAGGSPALRIGATFATCMGLRYVAVRDDVKLHTWDVADDRLGVAVRKKPVAKVTHGKE